MSKDVNEMTVKQCNEHIERVWNIHEELVRQSYCERPATSSFTIETLNTEATISPSVVTVGRKKYEIKDYVRYILKDYYEKAGRYDEIRVAVNRYVASKHNLPCPQCYTSRNATYKGNGRYYCNHCETYYGLKSFGKKKK